MHYYAHFLNYYAKYVRYLHYANIITHKKKLLRKNIYCVTLRIDVVKNYAVV